MRKRKSPIALVTVLAVMASVAFGVQYATSRVGGNPADQPAPPPEDAPKQLDKPRAPQTSKDIGGAIEGSMKPAAPSGEGEAARGAPPGMAGGLTILNPVRNVGKSEKPKPNTSSTSAQWYDKYSGMGAKD